MRIEQTDVQFTLADLFQDTLTWNIYENYRDELELLVPNFLDHTQPLRYMEFAEEEVEDYYDQISDSTGYLYKCLEHFMENATEEDYHNLGITDTTLIRLIKASWAADETAPHIHKGLFNGLYGNFDFTVDDEGFTWIYEYNGNTPVLTYESIVVQDMFSRAIEGNQCNELCESWQAMFESAYKRHGKMVIVFGGFTELVNDLLTVETMAYAAQEAGHDVRIIEIKEDIEFDSFTNQFYLKDTDTPIDYMFNLFPWEDYDSEALMAYVKNYENLARTGKGTVIAEPPYKLIASNKAFLAYMTSLDEDKMVDMGFIPTYLNPNDVKTEKYVGKPVYGRMSSNIEVYDNEGVTSTEGEYGDGLFIYQPFFDLIKDGNNYYQLRMWVAPVEDDDGFVFAPCGLAVRKSTSASSMNVETEEFIPHNIV